MREVPKSGPLVLKGGGQLTPLTPPLATGLIYKIILKHVVLIINSMRRVKGLYLSFLFHYIQKRIIFTRTLVGLDRGMSSLHRLATLQIDSRRCQIL